MAGRGAQAGSRSASVTRLLPPAPPGIRSGGGGGQGFRGRMGGT